MRKTDKTAMYGANALSFIVQVAMTRDVAITRLSLPPNKAAVMVVTRADTRVATREPLREAMVATKAALEAGRQDHKFLLGRSFSSFVLR